MPPPGAAADELARYPSVELFANRAREVNPSIRLDEAATGYKDFDQGAAKKFVIDPHGLARRAA